MHCLCSAYVTAAHPTPRQSVITFLDPYSQNRRLPLAWLARLLLLALAAGVAAAGWWLLGAAAPDASHAQGAAAAPHPPAAAGFTGADRCTRCHEAEAAAWRRSDHARAMQPASDATVLGDFADASFEHAGVATRFFRRDGRFLLRTDGPDGAPAEFEAAFTFGADPLQQYLVPMPDGRLQCLSVAWDARPAERGGQRWFHLYGSDPPAPGDPLHWTGRDQTWNDQCAECHSTDLRRGDDAAGGRFATAWTDVSVACEACHGPGAAHVAWAEALGPGAEPPEDADRRVVAPLARPPGSWRILDEARGVAEWVGDPRDRAELDACARCHARRRPIIEPYAHGRPLLDTHAPALLDEGLYHANGLIDGEVFEWGSFVQSRMHRAGVTCGDCHEPHAAALRLPGDALCAQCHLATRFAAREHHGHDPAGEAARCVACHMPARTYMVVDPRRDHSFSVPRPELSGADAPDACTGCHAERGARWAAEAVASWRAPGAPPPRAHFAPALAAARRGALEAGPLLAALALDGEQPAIARATAVSLLPDWLGPATLPALQAATRDADGLVRAAALALLDRLPPDARAPLAAPALRDPLRAVRLAAAHALADAQRAGLDAAVQADLAAALDELAASERMLAGRPESRLNLALLLARLGRPAEAEAELRAALALDARFVPALVNLADLCRELGREDEGEALLGQALDLEPGNAAALHALGLLRVRQGRLADALDPLRAAAQAEPLNPRFALVHAVALDGAGERARAIGVLQEASARWPADRDVLSTLAMWLAEAGDARAALGVAGQLVTLLPGDGQAAALQAALERGASR